MANFLALLDPDPERRRRVAQAAHARIAPLDGLRVGSLDYGDLSVVWAAGERAPISAARMHSAAAVVWGDAIPGPGPERLDAAGLIQAWSPRAGAGAVGLAGFHAALRYDSDGSLTIGADLLGIFPVYYASSGGTLLAGSSAQLFGLHPLFPPRVARDGLVGLLLAHAPLDGRVLLEGVRRLAPGHLLRLESAGASPHELLQFAIPSDQVTDGRFEDHVALLDRAQAAALDRHAPPGEPLGMLLSGGRDSRLLAGYLHRRGDRVSALTLGSATDNEVVCATAVARALAMEQVRAEVHYEDFPRAAALQACWDHLATGFSTIHTWSAIEPLRTLPARCVSGYLRDVRELEVTPSSFEQALRTAKHRGIPLATLRRLLRREVFEDLADRLHQRMREIFEAPPVLEQRGWRFFLAHDWRAHAGGVPWRLSFGSWPVLPILDREFLETAAALPDSSLANRRAQEHLLRTRFPRLARLPLDRNSRDLTPLSPSPSQRLRQLVGERLRRILPRAFDRGLGAGERRYYHRVYDLNNPGWRAVRRQAEPYRDALAALCNMDVLAELVPTPDQEVRLPHTIRDAFGPKLLIGLMLWHGREV